MFGDLGCSFIVELLRLNEPAAGRVIGEQLSIPSPVDRGLQLSQRLVFAELLVQHVVKELFGDGPIALGLDRSHNLSQQQHILYRCNAKQLLLAKNLRVGVLRSTRRNRRIALVYRQEAEQLGGIDDRQQVIDLEGQVVGQPLDVVLPMVVQQELQKAGNPRRTRM